MTQLDIGVCAGQVLVAGFPAGEPPADLLGLAGQGALGGFILFKRNLGAPEEVARQNARLIAACPPDLPPWIALDQEGGRVARLGPPVLRLPPMRVLGDLGDTGLTERAGELLGRQLRLLGFNLDFAPVLDVDTNPDNPVIGDRSFGRDPERVIVQARAFAAGLARAGIAACGKHFPGHGDTAQDSHLQLPRWPHDMARLRSVELRPFAALVRELPCLMSAHVVFDAIDAGVPATLSRAALTQLLRRELGYRGVLWSDDLEMKAIADHYGIADAAVRAIEAGCDSVLVCASPHHAVAAQQAIAARARRDTAFAVRLREAALRSLGARLSRRPAACAPEQAAALLSAEHPEALEAQLAPAVARA